MTWQERYQYVGKLDGRHGLAAPQAADFDLAWQGFYGESQATEPDRRFLAYNTGGEDDAPDMDENMRTWSWLEEFRRGFAAWT